MNDKDKIFLLWEHSWLTRSKWQSSLHEISSMSLKFQRLASVDVSMMNGLQLRVIFKFPPLTSRGLWSPAPADNFQTEWWLDHVWINWNWHPVNYYLFLKLFKAWHRRKTPTGVSAEKRFSPFSVHLHSRPKTMAYLMNIIHHPLYFLLFFLFSCKLCILNWSLD